MAEDLGDKTEAPTPRRREEAREQGQVARSPDLAAAVLLLGALLLLRWTGADLAAALRVLVVGLVLTHDVMRDKLLDAMDQARQGWTTPAAAAVAMN